MKYIAPLCNEQFVAKCIANNKRIDGRTRFESRDLHIGYGLDYGCVMVSLGDTKVLTSVSCEIVEPMNNKSYEGLIKINLDLSPMASPYYESNKLTDECVEISRMLERSVLQAKCIDLESLCLIAGEKVWEIRVDIIAINDDGNLIECASIALTAALLHFKRPNVSVVDEKIKIHSFDEKHPLSISMLCYPFLTKLVFYDSNLIVCDPNEEEEINALGYLIIGTNNFREVTAIHITGKSQIIKNVVLKCCTIACERTDYLMKVVKKSIEDDCLLRKDRNIQNNLIGFVPLIKSRCSGLFTYKKISKPIEIDESEIKETDEGLEFDEFYLTKMYRFKSNTDVISEEPEKERIRKNWQSNTSDQTKESDKMQIEHNDNDVEVLN